MSGTPLETVDTAMKSGDPRGPGKPSLLERWDITLEELEELVRFLGSKKIAAHVLGCDKRTISVYLAHREGLPNNSGAYVESYVIRHVLKVRSFPVFIPEDGFKPEHRVQDTYLRVTKPWRTLLLLDGLFDTLMRNHGVYNVHGTWVDVADGVEMWFPATCARNPMVATFYVRDSEGVAHEAQYKNLTNRTTLIPPQARTKSATSPRRLVPLRSLLPLVQYPDQPVRTEPSS